jgi:serine phosphatase RsbU (regulator of sigma subunit)
LDETHMTEVVTSQGEGLDSVGCAQVRGGNGRIDVPIELPGLRGSLHSTPSDGGSGGDVYFLSVCGSGLLTRICLADLVGHGERVARLSARMHALLAKLVNWPDHRRILRDLNASLVALGREALTTAAMLTYYPPTRSLTFTYAGHPPGWYYRARDRRWSRLTEDDGAGPDGVEFVNGMLGVTEEAAFTRSRLTAEPGDRLLLVTDGVLETPDPDHRLFGAGGIETLLDAIGDASPAEIARAVLDDLTGHGGGASPSHDDVTLLVLEVVPGPRGPALWHVVRNRLLRPLRLVSDPAHV